MEIRQCLIHYDCCCGFSLFFQGGCQLSRRSSNVYTVNVPFNEVRVIRGGVYTRTWSFPFVLRSFKMYVYTRSEQPIYFSCVWRDQSVDQWKDHRMENALWWRQRPQSKAGRELMPQLAKAGETCLATSQFISSVSFVLTARDSMLYLDIHCRHVQEVETLYQQSTNLHGVCVGQGQAHSLTACWTIFPLGVHLFLIVDNYQLPRL